MKYKLNIPGSIISFVDIKTEYNFVYLTYNNTFIVADISNPDSGQIVFSENGDNFGIGIFNSVAVSNDIVLTGDLGILLFKNTFVTSLIGDYRFHISFKLCQNYPNPFNQSTFINYQLFASSRVTLKIYDILGKEVKTVISNIQRAGDYVVPFDTAAFTSGVYFYRLEILTKAGKRSVSLKKMELLK